jgi:HK97 family phage major capsid protein
VKAVLTNDFSNAKFEKDVSDKLVKSGIYAESGGLMIPLDSSFIEDVVPGIGQALAKSMSGGRMSPRRKALTEGTDSAGGYLVEPKNAVEIIDFLREESVLLQAGMREIPMPLSGQLNIPKLTGGATVYWPGEGASITNSSPTFGQLSLSAKKATCLIYVSNELMQDSSPAVEAILREDMSMQLSDAMDSVCIAGGGSNQPRGILGIYDAGGSSITTASSNGTGANGDTLTIGDFEDIEFALINAKVKKITGWIMHPKTLQRAMKLRVDAVSASDAAGAFAYNPTRSLAEPSLRRILGYPVFATTNVPTTRTKGASGAVLVPILCGNFRECIIGMRKALEITATQVAGTAFADDQTWIKAIMRYDFGLRTEPSICLMDDMIQ